MIGEKIFRRMSVTLVILLAGVASSPAAELVMFDSSACEYCELWDQEIAAIYPKTDEGRRAPLRRVSVHDPLPADLQDIKAIVYTPTFVLVEKGRELGRITGYPGEDFFWGFLETLIAKLPPSGHACSGSLPPSETPTERIETC